MNQKSNNLDIEPEKLAVSIEDQEARKLIAKQTAEFLKSGKKITKVAAGVCKSGEGKESLF